MENKIKHEDQHFSQIILPILLSSIVVFAIVAAIVYFNRTDSDLIGKSADILISFVLWLFTLVGIGGFFCLCLLSVLVVRWRRQLPYQTEPVINEIIKVEGIITRVLDKAADTFIKPKSWKNGFKNTINSIFTK